MRQVNVLEYYLSMYVAAVKWSEEKNSQNPYLQASFILSFAISVNLASIVTIIIGIWYPELLGLIAVYLAAGIVVTAICANIYLGYGRFYEGIRVKLQSVSDSEVLKLKSVLSYWIGLSVLLPVLAGVLVLLAGGA